MNAGALVAVALAIEPKQFTDQRTTNHHVGAPTNGEQRLTPRGCSHERTFDRVVEQFEASLDVGAEMHA